LMNIYVSPDSPYFCSVDGVVFSRDQLTLVMFPTGRTGGYTVPAGVQTIGEEAFAASILDTVVFPDSVTKVREAAFFGARIRACTLPNSVKNIEYNTFTYCDSLTSVTIPDSVTAIGWGAFEGCSSLTDVYYAGLPAQWATIRMGEGNDPLQQATIHYIPWPEAQTLVLPAELTEIGEEAFAGGAFTYVRLAEHTTAIGAHAFADCAQLQYIYIPAACTEIAPDAFEGVSDLTILGPADSAAQRFASAHGLRFLIS